MVCVTFVLKSLNVHNLFMSSAVNGKLVNFNAVMDREDEIWLD